MMDMGISDYDKSYSNQAAKALSIQIEITSFDGGRG
jgi:hypothetical protein